MIKTDILFTGYYGHFNTGDDAFVEVASWGAKQFWKKENNRFLVLNAKLPQTVIPAKGYPVNLPKTYSMQKQLLLHCTDYLISAGGSTIHSKLNLNNPKQIALNLKKSGKNIKTGAIGVSVGPFKTIADEKAVQEYLKSIDFIALRDQHSYDYVKSIDTPYKPVNAFDLAALLPELYNYSVKAQNTEGKRVVGISVCPVESVQKGMDIANENKRNKMIVDLLKEIDKNADVHFKFFIINGNDITGDYTLTQETIQKVKPQSFEVVEYSSNTQSVWRSIAACDFVLSTRLHAAIFACFAGVPFMLNEYHRKCTDFLDNIDYASENRLYNSDYDVEIYADKIIDIIHNQNKYLFPMKVEDMKRLAKKNFTEIVL